jgi:hypothetical protein
MPDPGVHDADLGVHDARSGRSRCADLGVHDAPISVFTMLRFRCSRCSDFRIHVETGNCGFADFCWMGGKGGCPVGYASGVRS